MIVVWGVHPMRGNEAEIFIIAISGRENKFFAILGGMKFFAFLEGKEILIHERLGDVFRGKCTYLAKKKEEKCKI